jgi:hypothetical protein
MNHHFRIGPMRFRFLHSRRLFSIAFLVTLAVFRPDAHAQFTELCGDADGNGEVTVTDGVNALRAAADLSSTCSLAVCDVDGNGSVTVTDGVNILRHAAGLPSEDNCGGEPDSTPTPTSTPPIEVDPTVTPTPQPTATPIPQPTFTPSADLCCKHCTNSLPCGNSCISFSFICHQPPGCACF